MNMIKKYISIGFLFLCLMYFISTLFIYPMNIGLDQAMYLYSGKLILAGQVPFVDFFDINPPPIMYLSAIVVWLSKLLEIHEILMFKFFLIVIILIFIYFLNQFFTKIYSGSKSLLLISLIFLAFSNHTIVGTIGQRDFLFTLGLILYLILRYYRLEFPGAIVSKSRSIFVAVFFSITMCFKPFFLFHFILTELYLYLNNRKKKLDIEIYFITAIQILYGIYLLTMQEPAWSNFWIHHVPNVYNYYSSFQFYQKMKFDLYIILPIISSFVFITLGFNFKLLGIYPRILFLNIIIASMNYYLQSKFFLYHLITIELLLFIVLFQLQHLKIFGKVTNIFLVFLFLVWQFSYYQKICIFYNFKDMGKYGEGRYSYLNDFLKKNTSAEDFILPLSSSVWIEYPTLNIMKLNNSSRYLFQYPLSFYGSQRYVNGKFLETLNNDKALADEDEYFSHLRQDIIKYQPKIIIYLENRIHKQNLPEYFPLGKYLEFKGILSFIKEHNYVLKEKSPDGFYFYIRN